MSMSPGCFRLKVIGEKRARSCEVESQRNVEGFTCLFMKQWMMGLWTQALSEKKERSSDKPSVSPYTQGSTGTLQTDPAITTTMRLTSRSTWVETASCWAGRLSRAQRRIVSSSPGSQLPISPPFYQGSICSSCLSCPSFWPSPSGSPSLRNAGWGGFLVWHWKGSYGISWNVWAGMMPPCSLIPFHHSPGPPPSRPLQKPLMTLKAPSRWGRVAQWSRRWRGTWRSTHCGIWCPRCTNPGHRNTNDLRGLACRRMPGDFRQWGFCPHPPRL